MRAAWKAVTVDYQQWAAIEGGPVCYALDARQVSLVLTALTVYRWSTRWENAGGADVVSIVNDIEAALSVPCSDGGLSLEFRQSGDDNCLLEYSRDGGVTWALAFDYSLCGASGVDLGSDIDIFNEGDTYLTEITNIYNNNPADLTVGFDGLTANQQYKILCYATRAALTGLMVEFARIKQRQEEEDEFVPSLVAITAGIAAAILAPFTGGASVAGWLAWAAGITASTVGAWVLLNDTAPPAELTERDNINDAACALIAAWNQGKPSEADYRSQAGATSGNPVAADILRVAAPFMDNVDAYIAFLAALESYPGLVEVLPPCPCPDWCYQWVWDELGGTGDWTINTGSLGQSSESGVGLVINGDNSSGRTIIDISLSPASAVSINKVAVTVSGIGSEKLRVRVYGTADGSESEIADVGGINNGRAVIDVEPGEYTEIRINGNREFSWQMVAASLYGPAINPFGQDNC